MTNKEILEKAIQKAISNSWDFDGLLAPMDPGSYEVIAPFNGNYLRIITKSWTGEESNEGIEPVIYSKNFAKALWGEEPMIWNPLTGVPPQKDNPKYIWQYHLTQMVIADDPIQYLGENL